ncbi:MAG: SAM-dependent methyltransferase [Gemmatimonadota bacterium]|nr:SAM-dependent methyltransferase [Gemmatimonadota bacterium]
MRRETTGRDLAAWRPLAAALAACHAGDGEAAVEVRSDLGPPERWPAALFLREEAAFSGLEREALRLCGPRVVDLGAGAGPHARVLQARGHEVVALEPAPGLAGILRARGVRRVVCAGTDAIPPAWADTVLALMNGLGLAGTLRGLAPFLRAAARGLAPGGRIVADSTDLRGTGLDAGDGRREDGRYVGEAQFQLAFRGSRGAPFGFLYVDPDTLRRHAAAADLALERVLPFPDGAFLAVLAPVGGDAARAGGAAEAGGEGTHTERETG